MAEIFNDSDVETLIMMLLNYTVKQVMHRILVNIKKERSSKCQL